MNEMVSPECRLASASSLNEGDEDDTSGPPEAASTLEQSEPSWDGMLERLRQFRERHGTLNVNKTDDPLLASWIRSQRQQYRVLRDDRLLPSGDPGESGAAAAAAAKAKARRKQGGGDDRDGGDDDRLTPERVVELERLGFEWDFRAENEAAWRDRLEDLRLYRTVRGHCLVPARYPANPQLGHWVMTQRRQYCLMKQGKPSTMTKERMLQLDELGFTWTTRDDPEFVWNQRLQELKECKAERGDCLVPQRWPANPQLGTWVNTQRRHYKLLRDGKRSSMTPDRIRILESVGFSWSSPKAGSLETQLGTLRKDNGEREGGRDTATCGADDALQSSDAQVAEETSCKDLRRNYLQMAGGVAPGSAAGQTSPANADKRPRLLPNGRGSDGETTRFEDPSSFGGDRRQLQIGLGSTSAVITDPSQNIVGTAFHPALQQQLALANPALIAAGRHLVGNDMMRNAMTNSGEASGPIPGIAGGGASAPSEGGAWVCSFCRAASFGSYEDACLHEMRCAIAARQCTTLY